MKNNPMKKAVLMLTVAVICVGLAAAGIIYIGKKQSKTKEKTNTEEIVTNLNLDSKDEIEVDLPENVETGTEISKEKQEEQQEELTENETENVVEAKPLIWVSSTDSVQELDYMVYIPDSVDENTPIFLFLHGDGDTAKTFDEEIERYVFLKELNNGHWQPETVIVIPVSRKTGNWDNEAENVKAILDEVAANIGGSKENMYISGASAGADGLNTVAKLVDFKGAVFMAGHMTGKEEKTEINEWLELWQNKTVYYYRDNKYNGGGYGYKDNVALIDAIANEGSDYNITFSMVDLEWNHDIGLVDATFLPNDYTDLNGQCCHNGIEKAYMSK